MADISFAPKRKFPREFRAQTARLDLLRAKTEPPQHKRRRAERLLLDPVATGLQSEATKWPMQSSLPEKLNQKKFISQETDYTCISSISSSDIIVMSEPFCKFITCYMNDLDIMSDSSVTTRHLGQMNHSLLHIALNNACIDKHFCMWMLLQLLEMTLLQVSYLKN